MSIKSESVFEDLAFQKIKGQITKKLNDLLLDVVDVEDVSESEKHQAEAKCLEMFQRVVNEYATSKQQQLRLR